MTQLELVLLFACGGFFMLGCGLGLILREKAVLFWRIKWIEMEHDLARAEKREPRKIDDTVKP